MSVFAEGTKELAPNAQISINGETTTDIAALNIGNSEYRFFAEFNKSDENARLNIHITDPSTESIFLGFSAGHSNSGYGSGPVPRTANSVAYRYYVKDPSGNIIYTSDIIDGSNANISNWQEAVNGPDAFTAGGYAANVLDPSVLMNQGNTAGGNYYVEFELLENPEPNPRFLLIDFWDITVVNNNAPRTGRIWSKNWGLFAVNDYGFPERPFNGSFYVCAPDPADPAGSYITKIDFDNAGFKPGGFNVLFNSFGTDESLGKIESRKSVMGASNSNSGNVAVPEYDIYLNDPVDICITAEAGMINLNGVTTCDGNANYCIEFLTDKPGTINLLLDFDGADGIYTPGTADILMNRTLGMSEIGTNQCFDWDGLDGLGQVVDGIRILLSYEQGEYHFPIYDAEFLTDGFMIERVRPAGPVPKLFYDDSNIDADPFMSGTQPVDVDLLGCTTPCHNWDNYTAAQAVGFGNLNTINSWWFSNRIVLEETVEFPAVLFCSVNGVDQICEGESTTLELGFDHTPTSSLMPQIASISWSGPGIVSGGDTEAPTVNAGGTYNADVEWITPTGDICNSSCSFSVTEIAIDSVKIDTTIAYNTVLELNGDTFDTSGTYTQVLTSSTGCESIVTICLIVETPDVVLSCDISSNVAGLCPGSSGELVLTTSHTPTSAPFPTIVSTDWTTTGSGTVTPNSTGATIVNGGDYTATITYLNLLGETLTTTCSVSIDEYPTSEVKIDTTVGFGEVFEANGMVYDATGNYTQVLSTVNGCDSTVVYCVVVEIPDLVLNCSISSNVVGLCPGSPGELTLTSSHSPSAAPFPTIVSTDWTGTSIVTPNANGATVQNGGDYTATITYLNLLGDSLTTSCSISIDEYPTYQIKVDTTVGFDEVFEANGMVYDATGNYTQNLSSVNGCDSTVVYCVVVEIPDVSLTCNISGPNGVCSGEFDALVVTTTQSPVNAPAPIINSIVWSGAGIINSNGDAATVVGGETYTVDISYTNVAGETRLTTCSIAVDLYPTYDVKIDTIIEAGQVININGIDYDSAGNYVDARLTTQGCDSIVRVCVVEESNMLCYDLNNCKSTDYSRFTSKLNPEFDCAEVSASVLFRENPSVNGHSCTEGVNGSNAMCISSVDNCSFDPGNERSAVIEVAIYPNEGENVRITSLDFFEKAPENYQWIVGHSGVNNYPTMYGVRVLKNTQEIYSSIDNPTSFEWTQERFRFSGNSEFIIDSPTLLRFELLGYCTIGNGADVNAWDLDEIKINASCTSAEANQVVIAGNIVNSLGEPLSQVKVSLDTDNPYMISSSEYTDSEGDYAFTELTKGYEYFVKPDLNNDFLKGVSTADLIHIQRHVLGLSKFKSPFQMIAADANNSKNITAIDILELRKLILGITEEFTNNTSYRFAKSGQELSLDNPWNVQESEMLNNAEEDQMNLDFEAIKVGDVSAFEVTIKGKVDIRSNNETSIKAENVFAKRNEVVELDLQLSNIAELEGFQFALDLKGAEFVSLEGLDDNGIAYHFDQENNVLKVSWFTAEENIDFVDFKLNLLANNDAWVSDMVKLNASEIKPLVYTGLDLVETELDIQFNNKVTEDFIAVSPNPFSESFNIELSSSLEKVYSIDIFDVSGKLLFKSHNEIVNGSLTKNITKSDIGNYKGVIVVKINNSESMMTQRILSL